MNAPAPLWFSVWCKPRQEAVAEENLQRQGFNVYLPRLQTKQRRRGKWVDVIEALFPRYLFVQVDPLQRSTAPIRSTRGAIGLVSFGREPAVVPNQMVNLIMQREDEALGMRRDERPLFAAGDPIRLAEGPLAGVEGIFAQEDGEQRVLVLLDLLGKTNRISVSRDSVMRAA